MTLALRPIVRRLLSALRRLLWPLAALLRPPLAWLEAHTPVIFYTHPFELALGAALAINGLRGFIGGASPSVAALPTLPLFLYLVVSTLGGLGVITGLLLVDRAGARFMKAAFGLALERASLYLVAAAYAGLGGLLVGVNGSRGVGTAVVVVVVALACILRTVAIRRSVRAITRALRRERLRQVGGVDA